MNRRIRELIDRVLNMEVDVPEDTARETPEAIVPRTPGDWAGRYIGAGESEIVNQVAAAQRAMQHEQDMWHRRASRYQPPVRWSGGIDYGQVRRKVPKKSRGISTVSVLAGKITCKSPAKDKPVLKVGDKVRTKSGGVGHVTATNLITKGHVNIMLNGGRVSLSLYEESLTKIK
jgi:hypothetical protein